MGRRPYSLEQHVKRGTFRSRRHLQLLARQPLPAEWPLFARLQARYQAASSDFERRAIGVEFEQAVRAAHQELAVRGEGPSGPGPDQLLAALGKPGTLNQLVGFFPALLHHTSGSRHGEAFQLERWQQPFLREFHRRDRDGRRLYKKGLLGLPRGNGSSTLAAALGLYELVRNPAAEIVLASGSREQARATLDRAFRLAEQGPLGEWLLGGRDQLRCRNRHSRMRTIACHADLQHGGASIVLLDDLASFTNSRHERTYAGLAASVQHHSDGYLLATSTAGDDPNSLLGRIYTAALAWDDVTVSRHSCLTVAKNVEAGALVWWYGAPADADLENPKILRACNPASWINTRELQRQLRDPGLNESDFRRFHLNQWTRLRTGSRQPAQQGRYSVRCPEGSVNDDGRSLPDKEDATVATNPAATSSEQLSWDELIARIEAHVNGR